MSSQFRLAQVEDGPAIGALLAEVFRNDPAVPRYEARQYHWKFWQSRDDWPGSRSFVLERNGDIVAHAGVVPGRCVWRDGDLRTLHLIDWVAKPGALGAGGDLLRQILQTTDALLAIGGSADTRAIMPALGFKGCGEAVKYQRPVRPARQWSEGGSAGWRAPLRAARDAMWTMLHPTSGDHGWQARVLSAAELHRLPLPVPAPDVRGGVVAAAMERSVAMMRYLLDCPATPMRIVGLSRAGDPSSIRGYLVLGQAGAQTRLADAWIGSDDPGDWRALVHHAVAIAREDARCTEIVALTNDPPLMAALAASGFRAGQSQPVQLLLAAGGDPPIRRLHVQMLDNDAAWIPIPG